MDELSSVLAKVAYLNICVFVSALLYLFRFEALGIYIVMFVEVVKTLLVVSSYFLCI